MKCLKTERILIYRAIFGAFETPEHTGCSAAQDNSTRGASESLDGKDCYSIETDTVKGLCHGRRKCSVNTNSSENLFQQSACQSDSKSKLKVWYTCAPEKILKKIDLIKLIGDTSSGRSPGKNRKRDESRDMSHDDHSNTTPETSVMPVISYNIYTSESSFHLNESNLTSFGEASATNGHGNNCTYIMSPETAIGFIADWVSAINFIKRKLNP